MAITQTPGGHGLGRVPELPDIRDFRLTLPTPKASLPSKVSFRGTMPPVGDQGAIGSCTAWATLAAYRWQMLREAAPDLDGSELAQYYWARALEGTTRYDAGATIRDAIKVVAKTGMAPESAWPYDIRKFATPPPQKVKKAATLHQALQYESVPVDVYAIKACLAQGYGVVIGVAVYESFEGHEATTTGMVPMPAVGEQLLGGHALYLIGYDDALGRFEARGSWGTDFGDAGHHWLPYGYVGDPRLGGDYWLLRTVEAP